MTFKPIYDPPRDDESISPAIGHPKANRTLKGPPDSGVGDLECQIFREEYVRPSGGTYETMGTRSRFIPSAAQKHQLQQGGHIVLEVMQHPTPPVWMGVEGPPCECGETMQWNEQADGWFCKHSSEEHDGIDTMAEPTEPDAEMGSAVPGQ